ncbi:MAG TPA: aldo/keto reductase [Sedimentisphaerales bacterium]|nr:aldo/keto reductase [Sedimentisphaerales bacterium]HNU30794.1 aldo/keto reductase [Sedimentisphaerales bacterium]
MVPQVMLAEQGPRVSRLVHGLWRLAQWSRDTKGIVDLIHGCLEQGITTFDHADVYGDYACESLFGEALAQAGVDRGSIQLVTKCGIKPVSSHRPGRRVKSYDTSRSHIVASVENSLRCLRTEYVDLLLIHRPDPLMDPRQVADAFASLRESGKVRHFGVSNFLPSQFEMLASKLDVPLVTNQIEYSVMNLAAHADGSIDQCQRLNIRPMAWSPLGGGRLFAEDSEQAVRLREALGRIAREVGGASIDQVAIAWVLKHPVQFVPVLGSGVMDRIRSSVAALDIELSTEQWFEIRRASTGRDVP